MEATKNEVLEQIELIDRMIQEGRRSVEKWGWVFLLWGCAHVIALLWSRFWPSHPSAPWIVVTVAGWIIQSLVMAGMRRGREGKSTTLGRAVGGAWAAFGICMIFLWIAGGWKQIFTSNEAFVASFFILLGGANLSSGVTLRFPVQVGVGLLWWLGAGAMMLLPEAGSLIFVAAVLICEIAFGLYLMALEKKGGPAHA